MRGRAVIIPALLLALAGIGPTALAQESAAPWWVQGLGALMRGVSAFNRETDPVRFSNNALVIGGLLMVALFVAFGLAILNERKRHDARMLKKDEMLRAKDEMLKEDHTVTMAFVESSMRRLDAVTAAVMQHSTAADARENRAKADLREVARKSVAELSRRHKQDFSVFTTEHLIPLNQSLQTAIAGLKDAAEIIRQRDQTLVDTVKTIVTAAVQAAVTPLLPVAMAEKEIDDETKRIVTGTLGGADAAGAAGAGAGTDERGAANRLGGDAGAG